MNIGVDGYPLAASRTGVANYIEGLLTPLIRRHVDVEFYVYSPRPFNPAIQWQPNVQLRAESRPMAGAIWRNLRLPFLARRDRIDVFWGGTGVLPAAGMRDVPTVLTVHDLVYLFAGDTMPRLGRHSRSVFQPRSVRAATKVVAVSQATADDMARIYGRPADLIVPPIVSKVFRIPTEAERKRIQGKFQLNEPYLFTVGTLEPRKNLSSLIGAYELLHERGIHPPILMIAGGRGWKDKRLTERVRNAEEKGILRRLGFVSDEDLVSLYGCARAFIFPSVYEGFGMPLVEAQLCGTPVLYGHHAAMREAAGGMGVMFEPTITGIAEVLAQIVDERCPLLCRLPSDMEVSADERADKMWQLMIDAVRSRKSSSVQG